MNEDLERVGTTGFATGTLCPKTGSYRSSNKFMDTIIVVTKGAKFPTGTDGAKTTWYALSTSTDSSKTGFESVKVTAGTV